MIAIIDYNTGNLNSIKNLIRKVGYDAIITNDASEIAKASKLILPGVGHFDYGMKNLQKLDLIEILNKKVLNEKVPILGICLGVQLFTKRSDEGFEPGLGWVDGITKAFDRGKITNGLKIPHMGWSEVKYRSSRLFDGFTEVPRFYFVHSFHLECNNDADALTFCEHGYEFTAGIEKENIVGVQFHPEKSHKFGFQLMRNFITNY